MSQGKTPVSTETVASQSVFRLIKVVKPSGAATQTAASVMSLLEAAATNPLGIPLILMGLLAQYGQPQLGGYVLPSSLEEFLKPALYGDHIRKLMLQKIYGAGKGERVWNAEWSQRQIEIDLRVRVP